MASEYNRIFVRAAEDPGTAGDEGEQNWANLLREWLPSGYHVETKGRLIGHDGVMSPQVDVLVLKPSYPPKLLEKKTWLAGGVVAAFECKNTLTAAHIKDAVKRCAQFKKIYPIRTGSPRAELTSPLIYGLLAHSHSWKASGSEPIKNVEKALQDSEVQVEHPRLEIDLVCVADLGTWFKTYVSKYQADWKPTNSAELQQAFGAEYGPMTGMICSSGKSSSQSEEFRPVGSLISHLTELIARLDPSVRDIANYYMAANLGGSGVGRLRPWPIASYSEQVLRGIEGGLLSNGPWNEWSVGG